MEAYVLAVKNIPHKPLTLIFPKQNVQINMGCTFNYNPGKARRSPPQTDPDLITLDKNRFFPLLLEEWPSMNKKSKEFWRKRLQEAGIIPNQIQTFPEGKQLPQKIKLNQTQNQTSDKLHNIPGSQYYNLSDTNELYEA